MKYIKLLILLALTVDAGFGAATALAQTIVAPASTRLQVTGYPQSDENFIVSTTSGMDAKITCGDRPALDLFHGGSFESVAHFRFATAQRCERTSNLIRRYAGTRNRVQLTLNDQLGAVARVEIIP